MHHMFCDVLHNLLEGVIPLEIVLCLNLFVKRYFTLLQLNSLIAEFPYIWTDNTDRPPAKTFFSQIYQRKRTRELDTTKIVTIHNWD